MASVLSVVDEVAKAPIVRDRGPDLGVTGVGLLRATEEDRAGPKVPEAELEESIDPISNTCGVSDWFCRLSTAALGPPTIGPELLVLSSGVVMVVALVVLERSNSPDIWAQLVRQYG